MDGIARQPNDLPVTDVSPRYFLDCREPRLVAIVGTLLERILLNPIYACDDQLGWVVMRSNTFAREPGDGEDSERVVWFFMKQMGADTLYSPAS